jgi:hypothetical protein
MDISPQDVCLTLTSGGCNALNLLLHGAAEVVSVDCNPAQVGVWWRGMPRGIQFDPCQFGRYRSGSDCHTLRCLVMNARSHGPELAGRGYESSEANGTPLENPNGYTPVTLP